MLIREFLASGAPSISFEFFPPKTDQAVAQLEQTIGELRDLKPSYVSVTYGAGGSTRERTIDIVSRIKRDAGIEAMAHLTCVGSTREELAAVVQRLIDAGVENILALRGDPPKGETNFNAVEGGFRNADELVAFIRDRHGSTISIGGAAYPEKHVECGNPAVDINNLKRKVDAGVDFLITQLFFENRHYWEFVERARAAGITVPIIPGIWPITNVTQVERITTFGATLPFRLATQLDKRRDDPAAVMQLGVAHATSQCIDLLTGGAPGLHFYTMNRSLATRNIYSALRLIGLVGTPAG
jgi:methylenetetrahydrofolate reductase (NADPH)